MRIVILLILLFSAPALAAGKPGFVVNYERFTMPESYGAPASTYNNTPYNIPEALTEQKTFVVGEETAPASIVESGPSVDTWRARKGEKVEDVIKRWAERENTNLVWNASQSKNLGSDFSAFGGFNDAVTKLLAREGLGNIKRTYKDASEITSAVAPQMSVQAESIMWQPQPVMPQIDNMPLLPELPERDIAPMPLSALIGPEEPIPAIESWNASSGEPLLAVLRRWSQQGNVQFYSRARDIYAVKKDISFSGTYAEAIQLLLDQYGKNSPRPVGALYRSARPGTQGGQGAADVLVLNSEN
ncbi:MAG: hypothetical protein GC136_05575 [Alphaproteobacteria bacterium]|nr:hypothetical protein [Alphaproteobacteria bacterium]